MIGIYQISSCGAEVLDVPWNFYVLQKEREIYVQYDPTLLARNVLLMRKNREEMAKQIRDGESKLVELDNNEISQIGSLLIEGKYNPAKERAVMLFEETRRKIKGVV